MYTIALLGNCTILFVVKREPQVHGPMYYFLCILAITNLILSTCVLPKILAMFWFNSRKIGFSAYLTQLYFDHGCTVMESGTYVVVAFDINVDICDPLRHSTILTNHFMAKIVLIMGLHGSMLVLPHPFLARQWPYCRINMNRQLFCAHVGVVRLACANIHISSYLFVKFCVMGMEEFFVAVSCIQILRAICRFPTKDAQLKTFDTCLSQLCASLPIYISGLFFTLTQWFDQNVVLPSQVLIANVHLLIPPMLKPIISGVRTKEIWGRLLCLFPHKWT